MGDQIRGRAAGPCMWGQAELRGRWWPGTAPASHSGAAVPYFQAGHGRLLCCSCSSPTTYLWTGTFHISKYFSTDCDISKSMTKCGHEGRPSTAKISSVSGIWWGLKMVPCHSILQGEGWWHVSGSDGMVIPQFPRRPFRHPCVELPQYRIKSQSLKNSSHGQNET